MKKEKSLLKTNTLNILNNNFLYKHNFKIAIVLVMALFILQTVDFILTWYGVNITCVIVEVNVFMRFLFDINIVYAIMIRLLMQVATTLSLLYLSNNDFKNFIIVMLLGLLANIYILSRHFEYTLFWL